MKAGSVILLGGARQSSQAGLGPQQPAKMRAPCAPPYPQPMDYPHTLPFVLPVKRDLHFYRGNFCGIRIADAPVVAGSNAENPSCIMAALLDNYPTAIQDEFLQRCVDDGYTHLQRSLGHALFYNNNDLHKYIALCQRARSMGLLCDHWFLAGDDVYPGCRFQHVQYWQQKFDPIIPKLLDAGVVDLACIGWQLDQYNIPGNALIEIIRYLALALPASVPVYTHWVNHALAWWKTGGEVWSDEWHTLNVHDRFTWWTAMQPYLTGGHHQGDTRMAIKEYQDRICDTLDYFGGDTGKGSMGRSIRSGEPEDFRLTVYECSAQDQFDDTPKNPHRISETEGDLRGYLLLCTTSPWAHLSGYGNGARMPDGAPV